MSQVLDLSRIFDRHTVKIGDKSYELRNRDEFSLLEYDRLNRCWERAQQIEAAGDESPDTLAEASSLLGELATLLIVDLDRELPDLACVAIFRFWIENLPADESADPRRPRRRTTAASPRGSNGSTAATRTTGSRSRSGR